jgi:aminoglycoside phosphotransferase (APT) family kinase protein
MARPGTAPTSEVTDGYRADVAALLAWLPAGDRPAFERLLWDRAPLVAVLGSAPRTVIHGDLDDRNLGLRPAVSRTMLDDHTDALSELVLIDWEWMGLGTPALDVARVWATFPAVCDHAQPCPEAAFSGELPDFYLDRYRAYGGRQIDPRSWQRTCAVAMLAHALSQVRFLGSVLRHDPYAILPTLERQLEIVLEAARSLRVE